MEITYEKFSEYIGPVPEEEFKYIDAYLGKDLFTSYPNGGIFEYVTQYHSHPAYLFAIMSHKNTYLEYDNRLIALKPGELLTIHPGTVHSEVPMDFQSRYLVISMKKEFFEDRLLRAGGQVKEFGLEFFHGVEDLIPYIEDLILTIKESSNVNEEILLLEEIITHKIIDAVLKKPIYNIAPSVDEDLRIVVKYMFDHMSERLSLEEIVSRTTYSKTSFINKFKKQLGYTPMNFLNGIRIEKGKHLLYKQETKIKDIAANCGFKDTAHFSRNFNKLVGVSPKVYRMQIS